ncbi:TPA_asm: hypothetical protein GF878_05505 [Listeria monocytogenes]|uniref:hypothetical protein n=1 Tax=Listeria seeligeri TaxID=1640 RepID=UPI00175BF16C|nr:hypothetical protein [Listeria seeligeri]HAA5562538.1 hypothetical protein [Listeria monocytogenes]HAA5632362.1 hypothetical protein [Listeria monocytogenes]
MKIRVITKSGRIHTQEDTEGSYEQCIENFDKWFSGADVPIFMLRTEKDTVIIPLSKVDEVQIIAEEEQT